MKCFTLNENGQLASGITLEDASGRLTLARGHKKETVILTSAENPPRAVSRDGRSIYRASLDRTYGGTAHGEYILDSAYWITEERADDRAGCLIHVSSPVFISATSMEWSRGKKCAYVYTGEKPKTDVPYFTTSISESLVALRPGETVSALLEQNPEPHSIGALRVAGRDVAYFTPHSQVKDFWNLAERLKNCLWAYWLIARGFAR